MGMHALPSSCLPPTIAVEHLVHQGARGGERVGGVEREEGVGVHEGGAGEDRVVRALQLRRPASSRKTGGAPSQSGGAGMVCHKPQGRSTGGRCHMSRLLAF